MPSLPTSLILVGLVAAWLIVLVPMVARRRDQVPENDEETENFRVLRREDAGTLRRRPVLNRTAKESHGAQNADTTEDLHLAQELDDADAPSSVEVADRAGAPETLTDSHDAVRAVAHSADGGAGSGNVNAVGEGSVGAGMAASDGEVTGVGERPVGDESWRGAGRGGWVDLDPEVDPGTDRFARAGDVDPDRHRPVPVRRGRGGFNPEAAAAVKRDRYRQRRRVALTLLVLTAVGGASGALGMGPGWVVMVTAGVLLVLYFAYLRRQVRIEEEIRLRRAERVARTPRRRSEARMTVAEQVWRHRTGYAPGPGDDVTAGLTVTSHARPSVPMAAQVSGEFVELDDNDPAFEELEDRRPAMYRRRAS